MERDKRVARDCSLAAKMQRYSNLMQKSWDSELIKRSNKIKMINKKTSIAKACEHNPEVFMQFQKDNFKSTGVKFNLP
jgi:hypothetical protein